MSGHLSQKVKVVTRERVPRKKELVKQEWVFETEGEARLKFRAETSRCCDLFEAKKLVNFKVEMIGLGEADKWGGHIYSAAVGKDTWSYDDPEVDLNKRATPKSDEDEDEDEDESAEEKN